MMVRVMRKTSDMLMMMRINEADDAGDHDGAHD